jgi:hypothetical protein
MVVTAKMVALCAEKKNCRRYFRERSEHLFAVEKKTPLHE